ncbi:MAG TPA: SynChlorMet cassette protein ScmD [Thermodesulfovibrionales bacterium]|nr:SynChlorMet cassette protein ScmD [Thermodesulfovibrionales bacterium]
MNKTDRPVANPFVVLREEFDDWAVLFNPDTASAVGINPVGVMVWKLMDGKRSIDEIVSEVKTSFEDVPAGVFEEIGIFVDTLAEQGFVGYELKQSNT